MGEDHQLKLVKAGLMSSQDYDNKVADLVAYMKYMSEPVSEYRQRLGVRVLMALAVLLVFSYLLKREYWKDIH